MDNQLRIPPIAHSQWNEEVRSVLASFSVPFSKYGLNGDESEKDKLSPILSTVLQSPDLAKAYFPLADYLLRQSSLTPRFTRIVILRVAWRWQFEVEWKQHALMAVRDNILTQQEVDSLAGKVLADHWNDRECLLIIAVDQIFKTSNIEEETWNGLTQFLDKKQLVDLTFTIGGYVLAGLYMNVFQIPAG